jgi:SNF2 family DNA or RNA helicase
MKFPLFPYQQDGYDLFMERGTELLAFDTGLGKTATGIAIAEELLETRRTRRVLLVVPSSLKLQWAKSLAKFTDLPSRELRVKDETITVPTAESCAIIDGDPAKRKRQYAAARDWRCEYVITGYDQVVSDWRDIKRLGCDLVILDEASAIKTPGAARSKAVKRHLQVPYRLALTATPIENRPEEVFSIMQWVDETVLGRYDRFEHTYIERDPWGKVSRYKNLDTLHERLSLAMVRKTREDPEVAKYMPEVDTDVWRVDLDWPTTAAYRAMLADLLASYDDVSGFGSFNVDAHYGAARDDKRGDKSALGRLMSIHGSIEMLLNHPMLLAESARLFQTTDDRGSKYAAQLMLDAFELPATTPKLDFLVQQCQAILGEDGRAKVLVFSKSKLMLRLMRDRLAPYECVIYDGDMTVREKEAAVSKFESDPDVRFFLSSHAGAYGVDMPFANWLINYDIPWGAGLARQINGRHVRASSEFDVVHIRDMVLAGTIEERKLAGRNFKNQVSGLVIDGKSGKSELANDLQSLKKHAESVLDTESTDELL